MKSTTKQAESERDNLLNSLGFGEIDEFEEECLFEEEEIISQEDESSAEICDQESGCAEFPVVESSTDTSLFSDSPNVEIPKEAEIDQDEPELEDENISVADLFSNQRPEKPFDEPSSEEPGISSEQGSNFFAVEEQQQNLFEKANEQIVEVNKTETVSSNLFEPDAEVNLFEQSADSLMESKPTEEPESNLFEESIQAIEAPAFSFDEPDTPDESQYEVESSDRGLKAIEEDKEKANASFIEIGASSVQENLFDEEPTEATLENGLVENNADISEVKETLFGNEEDHADTTEEFDDLENIIIDNSPTPSEEISSLTPSEEDLVEDFEPLTTDPLRSEEEVEATEEELESDDEIDLNCPGCNEILTLDKNFIGVEGECVFCEIPIVAHQFDEDCIAIIRPEELDAITEQISKKKNNFKDEEIADTDSNSESIADTENETVAETTIIEEKEVIAEILEETKRPSSKTEPSTASTIDCEFELVDNQPIAEPRFDPPETKSTLFFDSIEKVKTGDPQTNLNIFDDKPAEEITTQPFDFSIPAKKVPSQPEKESLFSSQKTELFPEVEKQNVNVLSPEKDTKSSKKSNSKLIIPIVIVIGIFIGAAIAAFFVPIKETAATNSKIETSILEKKK